MNVSAEGEKTMENDAIEEKRWIAVTTYRGEHEPISEEHRIEEIEELDKIVEGGPDWNALVDIVIRLNPARATHPNDTVEAAAQR
jgi:hypothetical protein